VDLTVTLGRAGAYPSSGGGDFGGAGPPADAGGAVFVSNLQWWTTDAELEALCARFGAITGVRFIEDRACGKSRGMAVVEFETPEAAAACIAGLAGQDVNGRPCRVNPHRQGGAPGGGPPGGGGGGGFGRGGGAGGGGRGGGFGRGFGRGRGAEMGGGAPAGMPPGGMWPGMMMPGMLPPPMMMGGGGFAPPAPPGGPPRH
jgi:hypothetical protein